MGYLIEKCPICGKEIDTSLVWPFITEYKGKKYYCCSGEHLDEFEANPEKYHKTD